MALGKRQAVGHLHYLSSLPAEVCLLMAGNSYHAATIDNTAEKPIEDHRYSTVGVT